MNLLFLLIEIMQREDSLFNQTLTINLLVDQTQSYSNLFSIMIIIWMYFLLSLDNQFDLIFCLLNSNKFIL